MHDIYTKRYRQAEMNLFSISSYFKKVNGNWDLVKRIHQLLIEKDWLECIGLCNQLIESNENDHIAHNYRGQCKVKLKLYDEALKDFEISLINLKKNKFYIIIKEDLKVIELRIANIYRIKREYDLALERTGKLIQRYPKYIDGYLEEAGIYWDMDNIKSSLETVNHGLRNKPKNNKLLNLKNRLVYEITTNKEK